MSVNGDTSMADGEHETEVMEPGDEEDILLGGTPKLVVVSEPAFGNSEERRQVVLMLGSSYGAPRPMRSRFRLRRKIIRWETH